MKRKFRLPKKIKVGPITYKVEEYEGTINTSVYGIHYGHKELIKVTVAKDGDKRSVSGILRTFLHEVVHAVDYVYFGDCFSEELVDKLAVSLFSLIVDNNIIFNKIKDMPKRIKLHGAYFDVVYPYNNEDVDWNYGVVNFVQKKIVVVKKENIESMKMFNLKFIELLLACIMYSPYYTSEEHNKIARHSVACALYQVIYENNIDKLIKKWNV